MTMTLVSTVTVGAGGAASIDFTSIPQTGTDLFLVVSARVTGADGTPRLRFNGSTTGYTDKWLYGDGAYKGTASNVNGGSSIWAGQFDASGDTSSTFTNGTIYIPNYAGATAKSVSVDSVKENNGTTGYQELVAGAWSGTAAITSLSLLGASNFVQYSTASLYTITKGSGGATVS